LAEQQEIALIIAESLGCADVVRETQGAKEWTDDEHTEDETDRQPRKDAGHARSEEEGNALCAVETFKDEEAAEEEKDRYCEAA
jgi:hypothetical protein